MSSLLGYISLVVFLAILFNAIVVKNVFNVSTLLLLAVTGVLYYLSNLPYNSFDYTLLVGLRFIQGAFYGLSQLVLLSTLIIDTVEAVHRTEANHAATWFGRFALSFGPLAGIMVYQTMNFASVLLLSCICLAVSFIFVNLNKISISYAK